MENPILAFRELKGWSRTEFSRRTGINYQALRDLEIGMVKKISRKNVECLNHVGLEGEDFQKKYNEWILEQHENRKNTLKAKEEAQKVQKVQGTPESIVVDSDQILVNKQTKASSKNSTGGKSHE